MSDNCVHIWEWNIPTQGLICVKCSENLNYCDIAERLNMFERYTANERALYASLESQLADAQARLAWIPVGERLPEKYRDEETGEFIPFLVCENDGDYPFRAIYDGVNWGDGMFKVAVTHWMPLPSAPKEEE